MKFPLPILALVGALSFSGVAFAKTRIEIRGMTSKSEREVLQLMGDRLVYVRENPPAHGAPPMPLSYSRKSSATTATTR